MDALFDPVMLSRMQFWLTAAYHYIFVPLSIGIALVVAIVETRYFRHQTPENEAAAKFWVRIFTATFAIGVATGITMEFSFGTNWADYSRFVGNIFGAPLAAEALIAFFLESVFLGILIFGRHRIRRVPYLISAWLVFVGSALSALWIIIANSWMQTPAGAELSSDGSQAILTDFFAAAFNPSTLARYSHVIIAVLLMGAFIALAIAGWYLWKKRNTEFATTTLRVGAVAAIILCALMMVSAHSSAVVVSEEQPTKLAMMEGQYEDGAMGMSLFGWVDEENETLYSPLELEGVTSWLATGDLDTEFEGLNTLSESEQYGDLDAEEAPVNFVFQSYHLMIIMFGAIAIVTILALIFGIRKTAGTKRWFQWVLIISPIFPFLAIQSGWATAEYGRQPWVVYPAASSDGSVSLLTSDAVSQSVSAPEMIITLVLFILIYLFLIVAWARIVAHLINGGPVLEEAEEATKAPAHKKVPAKADDTDKKDDKKKETKADAGPKDDTDPDAATDDAAQGKGGQS